MSGTPTKKKIVICGGGIVGCSIAYHLADIYGLACTVVERCSIACAASGKAGGFLAKDWTDTNPTGVLARKSFDLHEEMGKKFGNIDYRKLETLSITVKEGHKKKASDLPSWVDGSIDGHYSMGTELTTAQVHPFKLTHAYMEYAVDKVGSKVRIGKVEEVILDDSKSAVTGVRVDGELVDADVVVIAMGPWSDQASAWFNIPKIQSQRAHSILLRTEKPVTAHAMFVEHCMRGGLMKNQEVYPRPDGDVYTCGMTDNEPLPEDPNTVEPNPQSCKRLKELSGHVSSKLSGADMYVQQACYLPISPDGLPIIGAIPGVKGAYIATGHSCWGILNSPATGLVVADLIATGKSSLKIDAFSPARFS